MTQYQNPLLNNQPWQQSLQTNPYSRNDKINFNQQNYQSYRQPPSSSSFSEKNFIASRKQQQKNFKPKGRSLEPQETVEAEEKESTDDSWEHHYAHRDRRDLYERIESTAAL